MVALPRLDTFFRYPPELHSRATDDREAAFKQQDIPVRQAGHIGDMKNFPTVEQISR